MSRYTYAGDFKNPTEGWYVKPVGEKFQVWIRHDDRQRDGGADPDSPVTKRGKALEFDDHEEAVEYIEGTHEFFEEDHSDYLEENRYEINQMEAYDRFRNEY